MGFINQLIMEDKLPSGKLTVCELEAMTIESSLIYPAIKW